MRLKFTRFLIRFLLRLFARVEVRGLDNVPQEGNFIIASNHLGLVDALIPFYFLNNNNLFLLVGEKWEQLAILRWLGKRLNFIFVDRFNPDLKAIRQVIARMKQGEVLVITPEGTRSKVGYLIEGKPGVSYLAAKLGYPIVPTGITGSFDPLFFGQLKRLKRPHIVVSVGRVFKLSPLPSERQAREAALQQDTDEIMCRIAALLPEEYQGFYAKHPRLAALLSN
jgi:1-acyl-sn-glycerol-3-phosphate acyltransferase